MALARSIPIEPWKHGSKKFLTMAEELNAKGLDFFIIRQMAGDEITVQEQMM